MSISVFILLALLAGAAVVYPLLPGRAMPSERGAGGRKESPLRCASCGRPYQAGDHFCVRCGAALAEHLAIDVRPAPLARCLACGAGLREGDRFCGKCGQIVPGEGA